MLAVEEHNFQNSNQDQWPKKVSVFGLQVSVVDYDRACDAIISQAKAKRAGIVSCHAAHAVVTFSGDDSLRGMANQFQMITPDGQPVRWAMNWLHKAKLNDRVYGPELMRRVCKACANEGVKVFLYGAASRELLAQLEEKLTGAFQGLNIVGSYSPPFRSLNEQEHDDLMKEIAESEAQIVFIGLGCPKQDIFAFENREEIKAIQICVGAAFDFHAGSKKMAPKWMQKTGTEWLFRLGQEPGRLWRRYLVTNTQFVWRLAKQTVFGN